MDIGEKIKAIRKSNQITQKKLSELTGIAEITIRQYEAGKYIPKIDKIKLIADALNVEMSEFDTREQSLKGNISNLNHLRDAEATISKILSEDVDPSTRSQLWTELALVRKEIVTARNNIELLKDSFQDESEAERVILSSFNRLNDKGQQKAIEQVEMLTKIPEYRKESTQPILNAAHERTDIEVTDEMRIHDNDIMDDDSH